MLIRTILSSTLASLLLTVLLDAATPVTALAAPDKAPAARALTIRPERAVALLRAGAQERSSQRVADQSARRHDSAALLILFIASMAGVAAVRGVHGMFGARA